MIVKFFFLIGIIFGLCASCQAAEPRLSATLTPTTAITESPSHMPTIEITPAITRETEVVAQNTPTEAPTDMIQPEPTSTRQPVVEGIRGISYGAGDIPDQTLTLYIPAAENRKQHTLLLFEGDGFPEFVRKFAGLGYPVIAFNMRNENYLFEIQDSFCALAWAHANADTYGFNADGIIPVGGSMWGGNAALLGLVDNPEPYLDECPYTLPDTGQVMAVIALAGVFDYSEEGDFFPGFISSISDFMRGTSEEVPENWAAASAINWVQAGEPPFLLVHGLSDTNVSSLQSEKFASALEGAGAEVELVLIPGVNHSSSVRHRSVFEAVQSYLEQLERTEEEVSGSSLIVFYSERDGNAQLYAINPDGSEPRRLTNNVYDDVSPDLSPDGSQIIFLSNRDDPDHAKCFPDCFYQLYMVNIDGSNERRVVESEFSILHPNWHPDGTLLTFDTEYNLEGDIYQISTDGSNLHLLIEDGYWGDWSPDGRHLVFASRRDGNVELYIADVDGGNQRRLTENQRLDVFPAWSPDGSMIAFVAMENRQSQIHLIDPDGSNERQVTSTGRINEDPCWSPDGRWIAFQSNRDGNFEIYILNVEEGIVNGDASAYRLTTNNAGDLWPTWRPALDQ